MAAEGDVLAQIRGLRNRVRHVNGSLVASSDGLLLAHDLQDAEPNGMAALVTSALALGQRISDAVSQGQFRETVARSTGGYVLVCGAGPHAVLAVLGAPEANVGRLQLETRSAAQHLAGLLEGVAHRPERR